MGARVLLLCNWCLEILTVIRILCRLYLHLICSLHGKAVVLFLGKNGAYNFFGGSRQRILGRFC